ncbi:zinc finger MYM-type protein 3-like isoform X3 [Penaeus japonicus]|uniref:zinc finger MYM-type protein 3-like isoform X3 n=1 Tax=Penaeus japonicus TaxID=27405 RepID=UPI001C70EAA5|nr:zinc finger MYM-type protein 3-like isoform X3 [Penaeus japonicus]
MDKPEAENMETDDAENPLLEKNLEEQGAGKSSEGVREGDASDETKTGEGSEGMKEGDESEGVEDGDRSEEVKGDRSEGVEELDTSEEVKESCDSPKDANIQNVSVDRDSASEESCHKDIDSVTVLEKEPEKEQDMECGVDPLLETKDKDADEDGKGDSENVESEENKEETNVDLTVCEPENVESAGDKGSSEDNEKVNSQLETGDSESTDLQKSSSCSRTANEDIAGERAKEDIEDSEGDKGNKNSQGVEVMEVDAEEESGELVNAQEKKDEDAEEDIIEVEVYKKPAEVVDLANDEEAEVNREDKEEEGEKDAVTDDQLLEGNNKGIKLRSLASLVEENQEQRSDENSSESTISVATPMADGPPIGEILEHGEIIGPAEMGGLQLRISNVVGGEDSITGLSTDEDRDAFCNIQISSVTTLMDPMSPEDPNQDKSLCSPEKELDREKQLHNDHGDEPGKEGDDSAVGSIKIVNSESLAEKDGEKEDGGEGDSEGPKIRLSSAVSEVAKDVGSADDDMSNKNVYHILKSILTVNRICLVCTKATVCEFRVKKKLKQAVHGFICTQECKTRWIENLPSDHSVEKPRLIFEKLCGMCGKDLSSLNRSNQFSWETREFCSQSCLTLHLNEVAGRCHTCHERVRILFIGKYCVRFGSDIHQFCSNTCLECYKTKIKVCCYCQKNLDKVEKVTSTANKEYCSTKCLKRTQRRDIGQQNYSEKLPCTVCQTPGVNRYEFLLNGEPHQLCSDPCLNVYKYVNKVKAVACCLCFRVMNAEEVCHYLYHGGHQLRVFCSDSCVNVFILSARKIVVCDTCKVKKYNFDMIHRQIDEDFLDCFYCSLNCLKFDQRPRKSVASGTSTTTENSTSTTTTTTTTSSDASVTSCNMCSALAKAQYHMVMSDNTLRSFCRYSCATKFKSTFGFQVDGVQTTSRQTTVKSGTLIRHKPSAQVTTESVQTTDSISQTKQKTTVESAQDTLNASAAELLQLLKPPVMVNKMTSCRPMQSTKGVFCKPHPWHRQTQTDPVSDNDNTPAISASSWKPPPILPIPIPVYVPSPMMMYNAPCPVPIFVPVPLPVPVFIPTTAKTTEEIKQMMTKIREEMPSDPYEAEMLLLARAEKHKELAEEGGGETVPTDLPNEEGAAVAEVENFDTFPEEEEAINDDLDSADITCLNTIEEDLPVYPLRLLDNLGTSQCSPLSGDTEPLDTRSKRQIPSHTDSGRPRKRLRRAHSNDSQSMSDPDDPEPEPEAETMPEALLEEDYQGPYLNKMYGLAAWKRWVTGKNAELAGVSSSRSMKLVPEDLLTMNCEELNYALCLFLKDLKKPNGETYQPDTIYYLLLGIQQHLFESSRIDCIFMDFGFEKFTNSLDEVTKTFLKSTPSPSVSSPCSLPVTRITEAMLWECRQLGAHTPQVLLNTLFYFNVKVFKLKTVEDHLNMSFVQIVKQWRRTSIGREGSVSRTALLKYYPKKSSVEEGKPAPNFEMHENREDPLRCPVKLYEFYLSKCPESVRNQRNIYYVYPERSCIPNSPVWFSTQSVQAANISKMLNRVLLVREVQEALTE